MHLKDLRKIEEGKKKKTPSHRQDSKKVEIKHAQRFVIIDKTEKAEQAVVASQAFKRL